MERAEACVHMENLEHRTMHTLGLTGSILEDPVMQFMSRVNR